MYLGSCSLLDYISRRLKKFQNANKVKILIGYSEANIDTAMISSQHSLGTCHN